jgi:uncharacterized protein YbjT (DUF2867 family)
MSMQGKTAILAGASGLVGGELLKLLLDSPIYSKVSVPVRKMLPITHPKLSQHVLDFKYLGGFQGGYPCDEVFCCLGTTIKKAGSQDAFRQVDFGYPLDLARQAKAKDVRRFLVVTAMGANQKSSVFYNRVKGDLEAGLMESGFPSLEIFRPSLLLGDRREFRPGEKAAMLLAPLLRALMLGPLRKYRPILAATVAKGMFNAAQMPPHGVRIHESDRIEALAETQRI